MAFGSLVLVLLAQVHGDVAVGARVDVRARSLVPADISVTPGDTDVAAVDLELTPSVAGSLTDSGVTARLAYSPTLRWRQPYSPARRSDTYHRQSFSLDYSRQGSPRPYVAENFSYGLTDLTTLQSNAGVPGAPPIPPTTAGSVPIVGTLQEIYVDALAGVVWPIDRTISLDTSVGYTWGGGADFNSRGTIPLGNTPRAAALLTVAVGPRDVLVTSLTGSFTRFESDSNLAQNADISLATVSERWEHLLTALSRFTATLGFAAGTVNSATLTMGETRFYPYPVASVSIATRLGDSQQTFDLSLSAGVTPFIDRYAATLYERVEVGPALQWIFQQRLTGRVSAGLATALPPAVLAGIVYTYFDGTIAYEAARYWLVSLNAAGFKAFGSSSLAGVAAPVYTGFQWVLGLGLTVRNQETF